MGKIIEKLQGKRVYFDTNFFVYGMEGPNYFHEKVATLWNIFDEKVFTAVTSEFCFSEILIKPIRDKDFRLINAYKDLIQNSDILEVYPLSREILIDSAELRAKTGRRLSDLFHLATALRTNCDFFITNDDKFPINENIKILQIKDF